MNNNYLSAISAIDNINKSFSFGIFIPSLNREVQFHQMTTSQQKAFIKNTMAAGNTGTSSLIYATHNLLKENCAEQDVNVDNFTVIDKLIACTMIRIMSVGASMSVVVGADEENDKPGFNVNIDLETLYNKMLKTYTSVQFNPIIKIENNPIIIEIGLPTVGDELKIEQDAQEKTKKRINEKSTQNEVAYTFGELFIQEIVKYIRCVTIKDKNKDTGEDENIVINMLEIPTKHRLDIIEKLPSNIMSPAIVEINKMVEKISDLTMLSVDHENQHYEYKVDVLNSTFFTITSE